MVTVTRCPDCEKSYDGTYRRSYCPHAASSMRTLDLEELRDILDAGIEELRDFIERTP